MARLPSTLRLLLIAAVFCALFFGRGPSNVAAGGLTVNTTTDAVDANPGADGCATAAADCSLRAAIQEANATGGSVSINVPAGTYNLTVADGDGSVDLDVGGADSITTNGAGAGVTIIDAGDLGRVLDVDLDVTDFAGIANVTIRNGSATGGTGDGGGIRHADGQLQLSNVALEDNAAPNATLGGGGLYSASGSVTIANSTISGNSAGGAAAGGGGLTNAGGMVALTNVTMSGNSSAKGGAVYNSGGAVSSNNVTISANTSANGIVFSENGDVTFRNTIVGLNTGTNCVEGTDGAFFSTGHNIISDASCPTTAEGDQANTDPLLGPLANNGGGTLTHELLDLSPAIDTGDDLGCAQTDQRGIDRPQGAHCDIGAFEVEVPIAQGDVDCSQGVDAVDALKVLRFAAGLSVTQTEPCPDLPSPVAGFPLGDVDCSGLVNAVDALKILRHNAALSVTQTEPCTDIGQGL
jgi:CSLREA domain-containing protein